MQICVIVTRGLAPQFTYARLPPFLTVLLIPSKALFTCQVFFLLQTFIETGMFSPGTSEKNPAPSLPDVARFSEAQGGRPWQDWPE